MVVLTLPLPVESKKVGNPDDHMEFPEDRHPKDRGTYIGFDPKDRGTYR